MNYFIQRIWIGVACCLMPQFAAAAGDFEQFKQQQLLEAEGFITSERQAFSDYQAELEQGFKDYKRAYQQELARYKKGVQAQWGEFIDSDRKNWVSYADGGKVRQQVNYETGVIQLEVLAAPKESREQLMQRLFDQAQQLLNSSEADAYRADLVAQRVERRLSTMPNIIKQGIPSATRKVLAPLIPLLADSPVKAQQGVSKILKQATVERQPLKTMPGAQVMRMVVQIPTQQHEKAGQFAAQVTRIAHKEQISPALIYAVMETESDFNPRAKSHVPAFGLMQIVPQSAGQDASAYLFGEAKMLTPSYLYNSDNNIEMGGAYLYILYYRYLKGISDPQSRLYCAIAAYNTGAGNVARAFTGSTNISKAAVRINQLTPAEVYQHLSRKLPHDETRQYLKKVTSRMKNYPS